MKFAVVAEYFEQLERTSKRKELVSILAGLFSKASVEEAGRLAYLCQGRVAPFFEPVELGMGESWWLRRLAGLPNSPGMRCLSATVKSVIWVSLRRR